MTENDKIIFEGVAADTLESLGYELRGGGKTTALFYRLYYTVYDKAYRQFWLLLKRFVRVPDSKAGRAS